MDKNDSRKINESFQCRDRDTRKRKTDEPMYVFDSLDEDAGKNTEGQTKSIMLPKKRKTIPNPTITTDSN